MEKFKYIIIFALILALGLLYYQFEEYKNISKNLVSENNYQDKIINELKAKLLKEKVQNKDLNNTVNTQREKIISLEENLSKTILKINNINFSIKPKRYDFNDSMESNISFTQKRDMESNETKSEEIDISFDPKINLDEKKKIDGLEVQIKQTFEGF